MTTTILPCQAVLKGRGFKPIFSDELPNVEAVVTNVEAVVTNVEAVVTNVEAVVTNVEAVVTNVEAVVMIAGTPVVGAGLSIFMLLHQNIYKPAPTVFHQVAFPLSAFSNLS
ncbi:hypothetical protein [Microseira wollei]|uniref:Uncharacterized protein n=1 Tax=Microseira wollei NIES-4236 TaxID=2530354 RepID=A0AAV3XPI5_9CYAN|nr:hypothetical protein [Microseira wollei]GET44464.1 hypothetical protein MiSe_92930 [Microseira wollei NIES-4236]